VNEPFGLTLTYSYDAADNQTGVLDSKCGATTMAYDLDNHLTTVQYPGQGATLMRQFRDRGLEQSGIKLFTTGDVLDDEQLDQIGDVALGVPSVYHYSDVHPSELNQQFAAAFEKLTGIRANAFGVGAYDGMALIEKALAKAGTSDGARLIEAMQGQAWESPRGPVRIDPQTRDIIQNIYIRRVEKVGNVLGNVEFKSYPNVKDPTK